MFPTFTVWQFALAGAIAAAVRSLSTCSIAGAIARCNGQPWISCAKRCSGIAASCRFATCFSWRCAAPPWLLFGLALARPFFSSTDSEFDESQPLHAVVVIDNSLSMDYVTLSGSLLDRAKIGRQALRG